MIIKIIKLALIPFFLITLANPDSIYNLIKIPNLEIYELKTPNKLKYFYATKPFRLGIQKNIACTNSDQKTYYEKYSELFPYTFFIYTFLLCATSSTLSLIHI